MKVKTLLKKAIKIAKDLGLEVDAISFIQRMDLDQDTEVMELIFSDATSNFTASSYNFEKDFSIDALLVNFEADAKKYIIGKDSNKNKDLEV